MFFFWKHLCHQINRGVVVAHIVAGHDGERNHTNVFLTVHVFGKHGANHVNRLPITQALAFNQAHVVFDNRSLERFKVLPPMVTSLIHSGLEAGKIDTLISKISLEFEDEVIQHLNNMVRLVEPVMLGFAGILAGFLGLATLLPILEVVNHL